MAGNLALRTFTVLALASAIFVAPSRLTSSLSEYFLNSQSWSSSCQYRLQPLTSGSVALCAAFFPLPFVALVFFVVVFSVFTPIFLVRFWLEFGFVVLQWRREEHLFRFLFLGVVREIRTNTIDF